VVNKPDNGCHTAHDDGLKPDSSGIPPTPSQINPWLVIDYGAQVHIGAIVVTANHNVDRIDGATITVSSSDPRAESHDSADIIWSATFSGTHQTSTQHNSDLVGHTQQSTFTFDTSLVPSGVWKSKDAADQWIELKLDAVYRIAKVRLYAELLEPQPRHAVDEGNPRQANLMYDFGHWNHFPTRISVSTADNKDESGFGAYGFDIAYKGCYTGASMRYNEETDEVEQPMEFPAGLRFGNSKLKIS
jgi:hypothetical protein